MVYSMFELFESKKIKGVSIETIVSDLLDMGYNAGDKKEIMETFGYTEKEALEIIEEISKR